MGIGGSETATASETESASAGRRRRRRARGVRSRPDCRGLGRRTRIRSGRVGSSSVTVQPQAEIRANPAIQWRYLHRTLSRNDLRGSHLTGHPVNTFFESSPEYRGGSHIAPPAAATNPRRDHEPGYPSKAVAIALVAAAAVTAGACRNAEPDRGRRARQPPRRPRWRRRPRPFRARLPIPSRGPRRSPAIEEVRGSAGRITTPAELHHYDDRRRFLAVQMADSQEESYDLPHDVADLAQMIQRGAARRPARARRRPHPLRRGDGRPRGPAGALRPRDAARTSRCSRRWRPTRRRTRAWPRAERQRAKRELLASYYRDPARAEMLFAEHRAVSDLAANFDGIAYDLSNPDDRTRFQVRLLSFLRPEARDVVLQLAHAYHQQFGRLLPVSSLVRTERYQRRLSRVNRNATRVDIPPHATGMAFDISYKFMAADEQNFIMDHVARLESEGRVEALRENRNAIHVYTFAGGQRPSEPLVAGFLVRRGGRAPGLRQARAEARSPPRAAPPPAASPRDRPRPAPPHRALAVILPGAPGARRKSMKRGGSVAAVLVLLAGAGCRTAGAASAPAAPCPAPAPPPARAALGAQLGGVSPRRPSRPTAWRRGASTSSAPACRRGRGRSPWTRTRPSSTTRSTRRSAPPPAWRTAPRAGGSGWRRRAAVPIPGSKAFLRRVKEMGGVDRHRHQSHAGRVPRHRGELPRPRAALRPDALPPGRRARARRSRATRASPNGTARPGLRPLEIVLWVGDNIQDFPQHAPGDAQGGRGRRSRSSAGGSSSSPTRCTGPGRKTPRSEPEPRAPTRPWAMASKKPWAITS